MKIKKQRIILGIIIGAFLLVGGVSYVILRSVHSPNKTVIQPTASENTKGETTKAIGSNSSSNNTSSTSSNDESDVGVVDKNGDATVQTDTHLVAPTGTFVSNHHVSLSNNNQLGMQSDCTTTAGATCKITFTNGGITKSLAIKTTDVGGAAYWSWNVKDLGLGIGSWQVSAVATLSNQTQTSTDAMKLEISQ